MSEIASNGTISDIERAAREKYPDLPASTNGRFYPQLNGRFRSKVSDEQMKAFFHRYDGLSLNQLKFIAARELSIAARTVDRFRQRLKS